MPMLPTLFLRFLFVSFFLFFSFFLPPWARAFFRSIPRLLANVGNHSSSVNCVRWSPNGRFLATASDDKVVMVWGAVMGLSRTGE